MKNSEQSLIEDDGLVIKDNNELPLDSWNRNRILIYHRQTYGWHHLTDEEILNHYYMILKSLGNEAEFYKDDIDMYFEVEEQPY